jgi:hypothetical protein
MYHLHGDHYHFDEELYEVGEADILFSDEVTLAEPTADPETGPDPKAASGADLDPEADPDPAEARTR